MTTPTGAADEREVNAVRLLELCALARGGLASPRGEAVAMESFVEFCADINPPAESSDVSTPRPTDCAAIRSGEVVVLARDAEGNAGMTMVRHAK
jgi:hypothetical protein